MGCLLSWLFLTSFSLNDSTKGRRYNPVNSLIYRFVASEWNHLWCLCIWPSLPSNLCQTTYKQTPSHLLLDVRYKYQILNQWLSIYFCAGIEAEHSLCEQTKTLRQQSGGLAASCLSITFQYIYHLWIASCPSFNCCTPSECKLYSCLTPLLVNNVNVVMVQTADYHWLHQIDYKTGMARGEST